MDILKAAYEDKTIGKVLRFAFEAHSGQTDKAGMPYIFHPIRVASGVGENQDNVIAALLHDVMEDTDRTMEDLQALGISWSVREALRLLTRDPQMPYLEYIRSLKENPIAAAVKIADLRHNMELGRLEHVTAEDLQRLEKYRRAYELLAGADSRN